MIGRRQIKRSRERVAAITDSLNWLVEAFLKTDASHLWIIDSDVEVPGFSLTRLLEVNADIVTGAYPLHGDHKIICAGRQGPNPGFQLMTITREALKGKIVGGPNQTVTAGNGCLLIKRRVFEETKFGAFDKYNGGEKFRFRYFPGSRSSDLQFFVDAQHIGFKARIHGDVFCGHLPEWSLKDLNSKPPDRKLSVVIPHHNKTEAFREMWPSLEKQLRLGDQVVLVDDYTEGFELEGLKWTKFVRPMEKPPSKNYYRCNLLRNLGISDAKHDAVLLLDPDCVPADDLLNQARDLFDRSIVYGARIDFVQQNGAVEFDPRLSWQMIHQNRQNIPQSLYVDQYARGSMAVWGGCLLFSKDATGAVGWFSKEYNGQWGLGEQDFVEKCRNRGLRLKYDQRLQVRHLYHSSKHQKYGVNRVVFKSKAYEYQFRLNEATYYRPKVLVLVVCFMRPTLLDPCLRGVFNAARAVKVRLVNQADVSKEQKVALQPWMMKWAVEYKFNPEWKSMAKIRAETFTEAEEQGYEFVVTVDDDMFLKPYALDMLIKAAYAHPEFHAISGFCIDRMGVRFLGGDLKIKNGYAFKRKLAFEKGVQEVDYVSSGFRICRLDPLILQDTQYDFGYIDWDFCNQIKKAGLKVAVCGDAGGYHNMRQSRGFKGWLPMRDPPEYASIRLNQNQMRRHATLFEKKWGYWPEKVRF